MIGRALRALRFTNATCDEVRRQSPADDLMPEAADRRVRCIYIDASSSHVYRWLCQLTVAPYSYDWIDNRGRRSPTTLTAGADRLAVGQPFLIFAITSFRPNRFIAGRSRPEFHRVYGDITVSYQVFPCANGSTRLQANACLAPSVNAIIRTALAAGDKIMSGRQLAKLKQLAEQSSGGHRRNR